jgi:hypothetical protein
LRPRIDAAGHVLRLLKALLPQELRDSLAAATVMAMNYNPVLLLTQLRDPCRYLTHWNVHRPDDSGRHDLAILAAIKQHELLTAIEHLLYGPDINVEWQHRAKTAK